MIEKVEDMMIAIIIAVAATVTEIASMTEIENGTIEESETETIKEATSTDIGLALGQTAVIAGSTTRSKSMIR